MSVHWVRALLTFGFILSVAFLTSLVAGPRSGQGVAIALLCTWIIFNLVHLSRLIQWLKHFSFEAVPTGSGVWEDVYAAIYRQARTMTTKKGQLSKALNDFQNAAQALPDGVVTLDDHMQILWANHKAATHLGIDTQRDSGQVLVNLVRHPLFVEYAQQTNWETAVQVPSVRGSGRILSLQLISYSEGRRLLLTRDVTQIEKMDTMRRDFVANVSHELKTPLTVLSGFLETIIELPLSESQRKQYLEMMQQQTQRMGSIVHDLLTLSQLETAADSYADSTVDAPALIERLVNDARALSKGGHSISTQLETGLCLKGHSTEIASAFSNLISNAIRYTPRGGNIEIRWQALSGDPLGGARFSVIDTGPGIEAHHIPRLTERFYRVDRSRSRETGGTGLGLAIVKHVLSRHDAQLHIKSEFGYGSTFSCVFPAQRCLLSKRSDQSIS